MNYEWVHHDITIFQMYTYADNQLGFTDEKIKNVAAAAVKHFSTEPKGILSGLQYILKAYR